MRPSAPATNHAPRPDHPWPLDIVPAPRWKTDPAPASGLHLPIGIITRRIVQSLSVCRPILAGGETRPAGRNGLASGKVWPGRTTGSETDDLHDSLTPSSTELRAILRSRKRCSSRGEMSWIGGFPRLESCCVRIRRLRNANARI